MVKILPAKKATWVQFLGWTDPLEKGMNRGAWQATVHKGCKELVCLTQQLTLSLFWG